MEVNRRAYDMAVLYRAELRLDRRSHLLEDLAMRVAGVRGKVLQAMRKDGRELLEIRAHRLAKETHALPDDVTLLVLRTLEIPAPEVAPPERPGLAILTPAQRRVAELLINSGFSRKEIASEMGISEGTVRTHMQNLYRRLGVQSRAELTMMGRSPGPR
ncbi:MAG: response regulator transcription factor [Polyangiaceae bacterium]|nr:response regulator transcription factor [Polyangiaceae bacterium]